MCARARQRAREGEREWERARGRAGAAAARRARAGGCCLRERRGCGAPWKPVARQRPSRIPWRDVDAICAAAVPCKRWRGSEGVRRRGALASWWDASRAVRPSEHARAQVTVHKRTLDAMAGGSARSARVVPSPERASATAQCSQPRYNRTTRRQSKAELKHHKHARSSARVSERRRAAEA